MTADTFKSRRTLHVGGAEYDYYSLTEAEKNGLTGISRLPFSLKVLLENLLRNEDDRSVTADDIRAMAEVPTQAAKWRVHQCLLILSHDTAFADDCVDRERRPLLFVWGDSTAGALMPAWTVSWSGSVEMSARTQSRATAAGSAANTV